MTTQTEVKPQAATSANQFTLTGFLGDNPIVKHFDDGGSLTKISIAVNEPGQDKASWYQVVLWNKVGQTAAKYLYKGAKATVKGQFKFDTWPDKNTGEARRSLKLHVNDSFGLDLHLLKQPAKAKPAPAPKTAPAPAPKPAPVEVANDSEWDQIPF